MHTDTAASATKSTRPAGIVRITYTHDAMIDLIIQDPTVTNTELGALFNLSPNWISRVVASDAFQARLGERKARLIDPSLAAALNDKLQSVTLKALDIIDTALSGPDAGASYALDALGITTGIASQNVRKVKSDEK